MAEEPERGDWVEGEDGRRTWKGPSGWTVAHGSSEIDHLLGRPIRFRNAVLPDGTPVPAGIRHGDPEKGTWRRRDGENGFRIGVIDVRSDGVVFVDDAELDAEAKKDPSVDPRTEMQRDLALDPVFMQRIQDDVFAAEVYSSFCNREWRRADGERHMVSWRTSGGIVAALRRRGETYVEWYPYASTESGTLMAEVTAHYARLGWTELTREQSLADHHATVALLDGIEARPAGDQWPPVGYLQPKPDDGAMDGQSRLFRARRSGRVDEVEYRRLSERLLYEPRPDEEPFASGAQ